MSEPSDWEISYSQAFEERKEKYGLSGLSEEEMPSDLMKEIHEAVIEEVGPNPDE